MTNTPAGHLLHCPFCGHEAKMESDPPPGYGWWQVSCDHCGTLQSEVGSEKEAADKWNTRAAELEQQAPLTSREQDAHDAKILAGPSFFTPEAISRISSGPVGQQAQPNNGMTHWEGCWRKHHECAMAIIERSQAQPVAMPTTLMDEPLDKYANRMLNEACSAWSDVKNNDGTLNEAKCDYASAQEGYARGAIKELAALVTAPAQAQPPADGSNYVADRECEPRSVTFSNGRVVRVVGNGYLEVERVP